MRKEFCLTKLFLILCPLTSHFFKEQEEGTSSDEEEKRPR